jgi:hypothetical protein
MRRARALYLGEWVRARNCMDNQFCFCEPCSVCGTAKCVPVWFSIKTGEVRCLKCFDAEAEHARPTS